MIGPVDAGRLAVTKLKTRKLRLIITLVISSVLFTLLLAASFTVRGTINSVEKFSKTGFGDRYIVSANSNGSAIFNALAQPSPELVSKAEALQKATMDKKTAEAKRLGIEYDPKTDVRYVEEVDGPAGKMKSLNMQAPGVIKLLADEVRKQPGQEADFIKTAKKYGSDKTFSSMMNIGINGTPYLEVLKDGKEDYSQQSFNRSPGPSQGLDSLSSQIQLMSRELLKPFIFNGQSLEAGTDGSVPIIAPYTATEQVLGLKSLPSSAPAEQRLERLKEVRTKAAGYRVDVCYRNSTSSARVQEAVQQQQEIARNKGNKEYQMPALIKAVPSAPCSDIVITSDKRTNEEKTRDSKQEEFDRIFGKEAPESHIIKLRIVGVNADLPQGGSASVVQLFQTFLVSSLGVGWFVPLETAPAQTPLAKVFNIGTEQEAFAQKFFYAEFNSPAVLKKFLEEQNCQPDFSKAPPTPTADPFKQCTDQGKYFNASPFGSSSAALDDLKKVFSKVFMIVAAVIAGLAAVIMMGTIGRIIADSRRETAVFRAIGAKRLDISQIYLTYAFMLAMLIGFISITIGLILSRTLNHTYSDAISVNALVAFNVSDLNQKFVLTHLYAKDILYVLALITAGAILAACLPLLTNVRRNPIRDMRDER